MSLWAPLVRALDAPDHDGPSRERLLALAEALSPTIQLALQAGAPPDALAEPLDRALAGGLRALGVSTARPTSSPPSWCAASRPRSASSSSS